MKTLVIILSETRAHELTFNNFKKNVIDVLNADLCLCIGVKNNYDYNNSYYKLAKYHFLYDEQNDSDFSKSFNFSYNETNVENYEELENINFLYAKIHDTNHCCDNIKYLGDFNDKNDINLNEFPDNEAFIYHKKELNNAFSKKLYSIKNDNGYHLNEENTITYKKKKHFTEFLKIKNKIFQESSDPNQFSNFSISMYIHIFFLWFLQKNINEHDLINKYDRFIITRSDYIYKLPFPKMNILDDKYIWIPDGEDYGGYCDRLAVLSKYNIEKYINILECFYKKSNKYYLRIEERSDWNMEQILKMHLEENNLIHLIKRIPYISYCVRNTNGSTRWSTGYYSSNLGYFIKYMDEYNKSIENEESFKKSKLNINSFYNEIIIKIN